MGKRDRKGNDFGPSRPENKRIGRLDEQTLGYYRRVSDSMQEEFENEEDKEIMLRNVFQQLGTEALKVSRNQTVSTIVESLVSEATPAQLVLILNAFAQDWNTACTDRFASHVTQTLLSRTAHALCEEVNLEELDFEKVTENPKSLAELITDLHSFLMDNTVVHMQHTYASHVLRVLLEVLSGARVSESVLRSRVSRQQIRAHSARSTEEPATKTERPAEFKPLLKSLTKRILTMQRLKDLAENALSSPVLQTVLLVSQSQGEKSCRKSCDRLIEATRMFDAGSTTPPGDGEDNDAALTRLPDLMTHEVGSHLVEQLVQVLPDDLFASVLDNQLQPHILTMSLHPIANFILQRLIVCARNQEQFELIYHQLYKHIEDVLAHNHAHVIVKLAEGCLRFGTKQEHFVKNLMKTFHCYKPEERQSKLVPLVASLTTYDVFYKVPDTAANSDRDDSEDEAEEAEIVMPTLSRVSLHGAVLLQKLLQFGNPRLVTLSLLDMKPAGLKTLACDAHGSFVYDALAESRSVGEKTRDSLISKLKGQWVELACSKSGSRVLDKLWSVASLKHKQLIGEELYKHEHRLRGDHFGRFVWRNCALNHFRSRQQEWLNIQKGAAQKRKLFDDILGHEGKKRKLQNEDEAQQDESRGKVQQKSPAYQRTHTFKLKSNQPRAGKHKRTT